MGRPLTRPRRFGLVNINFYDLFYVEIVLPHIQGLQSGDCVPTRVGMGI